jgi:hypothetical protein
MGLVHLSSFSGAGFKKMYCSGRNGRASNYSSCYNLSPSPANTHEVLTFNMIDPLSSKDIPGRLSPQALFQFAVTLPPPPPYTHTSHTARTHTLCIPFSLLKLSLHFTDKSPQQRTFGLGFVHPPPIYLPLLFSTLKTLFVFLLTCFAP